MSRVYKYQVEDELKGIRDIDYREIYDYIGKKAISHNKIVMFKHTNDKKYASYYCTHCKTWHFIEKKKARNVKKDDYFKCPYCNETFKVIYQNNKIEDYSIYMYGFDINYRNELILRLFYYDQKYYKEYGYFSKRLYEVERINCDRKVYIKNNSYKTMNWYGYVFHGYVKKGWTPDRTKYYEYYPFDCCYQSQVKVKNIIKDCEKYKYSCLDMVSTTYIDSLAYIYRYEKYPKLELMMKAGCTNIVKDFCNKRHNPCIINDLSKQEMKFLIENNLTYGQLDMLRRLEIYDYEIIKRADYINYYPVAHYEDKPKKLINYIYENKCNITDYRDYLHSCSLLGYDLRSKNTLFPEDFIAAHDRVNEERVKKESTIFNEDIKKFSEKMEKYDYSSNGLLIRPAQSQEELIKESITLHHCVRTYAQAMAEQSKCIMFIRKMSEKDKPYVTLELTNNKVIQCRGNHNSVPESNVIDFVKKWCKINNFEMNRIGA